jgi:hypothetical protein
VSGEPEFVRRPAAVLATLIILGGILPATAAAAGPQQDVIVTLQQSAGEPGAVAGELSRLHGFLVRHTYRHALQGFAATLPAGVIEALRRHPKIARIEADGMAFPVVDQSAPPWGLDRIDQRTQPLGGTYS